MTDTTDAANRASYIEQAIYLLEKQTTLCASNGEPHVSDIERAVIEKVCDGLRADNYYIKSTASTRAHFVETMTAPTQPRGHRPFETFEPPAPVEDEGPKLGVIAKAIGGEVWHSGGGIFGVQVERPDHYFFFGFADGVFGWDINELDGGLLGGGQTNLTIDDTEAVIARAKTAIATKEMHFTA